MKPDHKFLGLDHLRALAISLVFIYHYTSFAHPQWMNYNIIHFGWCGVDLFFVLSGFLISNQLFEEWKKTTRIRLGTFYLKRIFRIFPPYFFVLLIYIFIPSFHERETLAPLWKMFTFTQNYNQDIPTYGTFSHAWSLCVEEQFYLLLPLILILVFSSLLKQKSGWLIPVIFILTLMFRWMSWNIYLKPNQDLDDFVINWYRLIYYPTYTRLDGLITGVGIASVYQFRKSWVSYFNRFANRILLAGLVVFIISFYICIDQHAAPATLFGFSIIAIAFGLFVLSAIMPGSILFRLKSFATRNLATLSYSLYLSHKGIIHVTQKGLTAIGIRNDSNLTLLICMITCIAGALFMRLIIEKPFFRLRNRVLSYLN